MAKGRRDFLKQKALFEKLYKRFVPLYSISFKDGISKFYQSIDTQELQRLIQSGDLNNVLSSFEIKKLQEFLKTSSDKIISDIFNSLSKELPKIHTITRPEFNFNSSNQRLVDFINSHIGELIQNVTTEQVEAVKNIITEGFRVAKPAKEIANEIKQNVGLLPNQILAINRYYQSTYLNALKDGKTEAQAERLAEKAVERYREKQLDLRALRIARTEVARVINEGEIEFVKQLADDGVLRKDEVIKKWFILPETACELCEPMDGKEVPFTESFEFTDGTLIDAPPAHPNCNCSIGFLY